MKIKYIVTIGIILACIQVYAQTVPLVFDVENRGSACTKPTVALKANQKLPDPFEWSNGSGRVSTFEDWSCRRNEIKTEIEHYEIGPKPVKPTVTATYSAGTLTVNVSNNGQTITLTSTVTVPTGTGPFPVIIGMNSGTGSLGTNLFSGVVQVRFSHDQVVKYDMNGTKNQSDPFYKLYPELWNKVGNYAAWSWGVSRIIDGLELVKNQINIDIQRIAVTGCSYAGKMALFAGAFDERIALTIAQESGGGGINSWRLSQDFTTRTGVNVEKIDNTSTSWFLTSMKNLNPYNLPHDHHELIAMIAPRAFLALGNPPYEWLGDESGYKTCMAALEVWKSMGVADRFGFDFSGGHDHCTAATSQNNSVTAFVNKFLKNTTANTTIRVNPVQSGFDLNYQTAITWTTPTLQMANADAPIVSLSAPLTNAVYESPASITITALASDPNNDLTKVEFYNGTTKLGEKTSAPFSYAWTNVAQGTYSITTIASDAAGNKTTSAAVSVSVITPFAIYKTANPIVIDGTIDALWTNSSVLPISATKLLSGTVTNAADLSGSCKALWDNSYLYILAEISDEVLNNDSQNIYDDDAVEIYVDIQNDKATTYGTNDVQYTFAWNDGTTVGSLPSGRATTGITYSAVAKTGGYIVEARIPWSTLQGTPAIGQYLGFDFMINDDDNAGTRDGKLSWNAATDDAWQNPSLFGTAILRDVAACTPPAPPTAIATIS
nr:sugar-binding protein [Bacteroidales bacterium]